MIKVTTKAEYNLLMAILTDYKKLKKWQREKK